MFTQPPHHTAVVLIFTGSCNPFSFIFTKKETTSIIVSCVFPSVIYSLSHITLLLCAQHLHNEAQRIYKNNVDQPTREHLVGKFRAGDAQSLGKMNRPLYLNSSSLLYLDRPIQTSHNETCGFYMNRFDQQDSENLLTKFQVQKWEPQGDSF